MPTPSLSSLLCDLTRWFPEEPRPAGIEELIAQLKSPGMDESEMRTKLQEIAARALSGPNVGDAEKLAYNLLLQPDVFPHRVKLS